MHKSKEDLFRTDGTAMGALAGASAIGHLLQKATYPDDAGGDRGHVKHPYNALSQLLRTEDQATSILEIVCDSAGQGTARERTPLHRAWMAWRCQSSRRPVRSMIVATTAA